MKNEEKQLLEKLYIFIEEDDVDNILKTLGRLNSEYLSSFRI